MGNKSFTTTIEVAQAPKEVFNHILEVPKWWTKEFEGSNTKPDDEFIIHHPGAHYSKQKVVEIIPDKKIVWLVTESTLYWLKGDQHEWTGTKMIFEISAQESKTILHFMHDGLVPEKECYSMCRDGWGKVINDHLVNFLATGKSI